jgi:hypothetical protein
MINISILNKIENDLKDYISKHYHYRTKFFIGFNWCLHFSLVLFKIIRQRNYL